MTYEPRVGAAAVTAALLCLSLAAPPALGAGSVEEGRDLAQRLCAACHAIDRGERSPISGAPAFRRLEPQVDLDDLVDRLQGGVLAGHPQMPAFVMKEHEARSLVAYMRSLQGN
ncbi:MAG: cytochrome c [Pseudorhodoplanes sp.]|uniref:c-type cytochrome n=1 Tax=Pseudorhodoplanes sp. TaxID=1934341 RepID=UPI003D0A9C75